MRCRSYQQHATHQGVASNARRTSTNTATNRPSRVSTGARTALLAAVRALGASTFGHIALAHAEWDIDEYDRCVRPEAHNVVMVCCIATGGDWHGTEQDGYCTASPAELTKATNIGPRQPQPGRQSTLPTATFGAPAG
jgi:hypothetical protein